MSEGHGHDQASWVKSHQPIFQRDDANQVFGPGHNRFFKSPDGTEDWIVYHATNTPSGSCDMSRSTRAQKITCNADGTPNLGTPVALGASLPAPSGKAVTQQDRVTPFLDRPAGHVEDRMMS